MNLEQLKDSLEAAVLRYNRPDFVPQDPIQFPHRFSRLQDVEIAGFFAAMLAWGRRTMIINSANKLLNLMNNEPFGFLQQHEAADFERIFAQFAHRTIQSADIIYACRFLKYWYEQHESLETAFLPASSAQQGANITAHLDIFQQNFFSLPNPTLRTRKHIPAPASKSGCKRLCMLLRWLVRRDGQGVDLGIWSRISPAQLVMPLDTHVFRIAKSLNMISHRAPSWQAALDLTDFLRQFDPNDPTKYDFALFSLGVHANSQP